MPYSRGLVQPSEKASNLEHAIHLYTHLSTIPSVRDFHISVAVGANKPRVRTLFDTGTGMVASAITVLRRRVVPSTVLIRRDDTIQPFITYVHHYNQRLVAKRIPFAEA